MWLVNIQILLHIIAVVCELMVLVSNRVVLLVVNVSSSSIIHPVLSSATSTDGGLDLFNIN